MPGAVVTPSLTYDVLHGNHKYDIPEAIYNERFLPLTKTLSSFGITDPKSVAFDPAKHILFTDDYYEKTKRYTLEELGITEPRQKAISNIGTSDPFPLFTDEAIAIMRYELFQKELILNCGRVNNQNSNVDDMNFSIVGFSNQYAPFTHAAWHHPRTLEIISTMAGVELKQMIDYLSAATNVCIRSPQTTLVQKEVDDLENPQDAASVISWHFDSPQFVCVLMMSDTSNMKGSETALQRGDGKVTRVQNPQQGWANILQGKIIKHMAPQPKGEYIERITQVSCMRPVDPMIDRCVSTTIKPGVTAAARYNDFYKDWMNYRLEVLSKRVDVLKKQVNEKIDKGELFDQIETINFIQKHIVEYAEHTWQEFEVVDDGLVEKPASYHVQQGMWI